MLTKPRTQTPEGICLNTDKPPKEYLAFFAAKSGEEGFSVQEIPLDPELLDTPAYKKFLEVRRERIATRLNVFITD